MEFKYLNENSTRFDDSHRTSHQKKMLEEKTTIENLMPLSLYLKFIILTCSSFQVRRVATPVAKNMHMPNRFQMGCKYAVTK